MFSLSATLKRIGGIMTRAWYDTENAKRLRRGKTPFAFIVSVDYYNTATVYCPHCTDYHQHGLGEDEYEIMEHDEIFAPCRYRIYDLAAKYIVITVESWSQLEEG